MVAVNWPWPTTVDPDNCRPVEIGGNGYLGRYTRTIGSHSYANRGNPIA